MFQIGIFISNDFILVKALSLIIRVRQGEGFTDGGWLAPVVFGDVECAGHPAA